jgi:hypothetical protein
VRREAARAEAERWKQLYYATAPCKCHRTR